MRNRFERAHHVFSFVGTLLQPFGLILLLPLIVVFCFWGQHGEGWNTVIAFVVPALASFGLGVFLRKVFRAGTHDLVGSMLICAVSWIVCSAFAAIPFVLGIHSSCLNGYFESVSGFTTTGITVFSGLDAMPKSILFWRGLTQWLGGIGILSFFLAVTFRGSGAHHIFGAESHKISSVRPVPGLMNTVKILWGIYAIFTIVSAAVLWLEGMSFFDSICHTFTALSTGGFSPHDDSIAYYRLTGHANYRLIEYTLTLIMMLGGMNFLVHYRVLTRDVKALWDNTEVRYWWAFIAGFTIIILLNVVSRGANGGLSTPEAGMAAERLETSFRYSLFQVVSILTTTGFATKDIASDFFPALAKQLFLVMMVIGGCVGSTGGGIKVLRVAVLTRLVRKVVFRLRGSSRLSTGLVIDKRIVPDDETQRIAALFFAWMAFLAVGGGLTALISNQGAWESFSGMFSALGNIGPCYISQADMIAIHPIVKVVYIIGMLAGRLEILPLLLLFYRKAWRW